MSCILTVPAGNVSWLTVSFFDKDGLPATPATVDYKIICLTTGTVINATGSITPTGPVEEIEITAAENAIVNAINTREHRRVIVTAGYGAAKDHVEAYDYYVRNLNL
ncbi:hypothetical protein DJ031_04625 [bacterium endosymbiont of Escarpia laminata]|nr:MAG: hypothetical protein DJ031_04625 [bacterium endosymbiont of Escarpia laminata]